MPKEKLTLMKFNHVSSSAFPCEFCGIYIKTKTRMRLHRKLIHGVTKKYDKNNTSIDFLCDGCRKLKCKCGKY